MRIMHTMLRVGNLDTSIKFYTSALQMKLFRKTDYPEGKFTLAFLGYDEENTSSVIELTYNWDVTSYEMGNGFGHIALGTTNINAACELIKQNGGKVIREPSPMKHGTTIIAFVEDPDGYKIELIQE